MLNRGLKNMEQNPYQTPKAEVREVVPGVSEAAVRIREEHISHEASVRSFGVLYYIGAAVLVVFGLTQIFLLTQRPDDAYAAFAGLFLGLGLLYLWIGSGMRALRAKVRHVAGVFAAIGLLGFPLGTLINGYILYLSYSKKGQMVFSEEYQEIRQATPHIKYKTSMVVWLLLMLLLVFLAAAILIPLLKGV